MRIVTLAVLAVALSGPAWSGDCPEGQTKLQDGVCVQAPPAPPPPAGGSTQVLPDLRNVPALPLPASTATRQVPQ